MRHDVLPAATLALLAVCLALSGVNQPLFLVLHDTARALPAWFWRGCSMFGEWLPVIGMLLYAGSRRLPALPVILLAAVTGILAALLLKAGFALPRPPLVLPPGRVQLLDVLPANGAFPSGHAIAVALTASVLGAGRGVMVRVFLLLAVLLVCWSRLAIGVHWPLDVLAGAAVGYALQPLAAGVSLQAWPPSQAQRIIRSLALLLLLVSSWQGMGAWPNAEYGLFHILAGLLAWQAWRQAKENGA